MGRAAKRTIGDLVFAVLTKNAVMADGKALFSTDHANLLNPGSAITTDSVAAMRVAMGTQTVDKRPVAVPLKKLIVPLALEGAANLVRSAQYRIGGSDNSTMPNVEQNRFDVIADARLDAYNPKGWFGSADPNVFDTIEVAYLDGIQQPFLDQKDSWNVDGTQYKVRIDAGVAPLDFRGLAKNPGA
jgi:phage major head subunit gpT-like protein